VKGVTVGGGLAVLVFIFAGLIARPGLRDPRFAPVAATSLLVLLVAYIAFCLTMFARERRDRD
jgi:hypothetical protein